MFPLLLLLACGGHGDAASHGGLASLAVTPAEATLVTTPDAAATQAFTATATFGDGTVVEAYELVEWSLSNTSAGNVEDGHFTASTTNGGRTWLTAASAGVTSLAELQVIYSDEIVMDASLEGLDWSGEATDAAGELAWSYPEDGVDVPRNIPEMTFSWVDRLGLDAVRLRFESQHTRITVVAMGSAWTTDSALWQAIAATNAGGEVTVALDALKDGVRYDAGSLTLHVNRMDASGALYYFSTTAHGVVRCDVEGVEPDVWFSPEPPAGNAGNACVGCHVGSRDGTRLAFGWGSNERDDATYYFGLADIGEDGGPVPITDLSSTPGPFRGMFATWAPDGDYVVMSDSGTLNVFDGYTGSKVGSVASGLRLTMPDWDPDGSRLVAVSAQGFGDDLRFESSDLVEIPYLGDGRFGEPSVILQGDGQTLNYYPSISPDGAWIALNRASDGEAFFAYGATLWLMPAHGGAPMELARANADAGYTNSWPRWGPLPDDDVLWLAFASNRLWANQVPEGAQIWVTGIDSAAAESGADPSYPAFRLPQQDLETSNHAPWWSRE